MSIHMGYPTNVNSYRLSNIYGQATTTTKSIETTRPSSQGMLQRSSNELNVHLYPQSRNRDPHRDLLNHQRYYDYDKRNVNDPRKSNFRYSKMVSTGQIEEYDIIRDMGDGSFGTVVQAERKTTGEMVAIKKMKKTFNSWDDCLKLRELRSLKVIPAHHCIIPLYDAFISTKTRELYFVFEYMDGNLYQLMRKRKGSKFSQGLTRSILYQMLAGLEHIHAYGYFHRDMKPENLLITTRGIRQYPTVSGGYEEDFDVIVKLADFGLAREIKSRPPYTEYVSTRWYRAPEVLLRATNYNAPVDLWAVGVILVELVNLKPLFPGHSEIDQIERICDILGNPALHFDSKGRQIGGGEWKDGIKMARHMGFTFPPRTPVPFSAIYPTTVPASLVHLTAMLLKYDPKSRPTTAEILQHPYFTSVGIIHQPTKPIKRNRGEANAIRELFRRESRIMDNSFNDKMSNGAIIGERFAVTQAAVKRMPSKTLPRNKIERVPSFVDKVHVSQKLPILAPPPSLITHSSSQYFPGNNTEVSVVTSTVSRQNTTQEDTTSAVAAVNDPQYRLPIIRGTSPIHWNGRHISATNLPISQSPKIPSTSAEAIAIATGSQPNSSQIYSGFPADSYLSIMPGIDEVANDFTDGSQSPARVFSSPADTCYMTYSKNNESSDHIREEILETVSDKKSTGRHLWNQQDSPSHEMIRQYSLPGLGPSEEEDAISALVISGDAPPFIVLKHPMEFKSECPSPSSPSSITSFQTPVISPDSGPTTMKNNSFNSSPVISNVQQTRMIPPETESVGLKSPTIKSPSMRPLSMLFSLPKTDRRSVALPAKMIRKDNLANSYDELNLLTDRHREREMANDPQWDKTPAIRSSSVDSFDTFGYNRRMSHMEPMSPGRKSLAPAFLRKDKKGGMDEKRTSKLWYPVNIFSSSKNTQVRDNFETSHSNEYLNNLGLSTEIDNSAFEAAALSEKELKKRKKKERKLLEKMIKDEEKERARLIKEKQKEQEKILRSEQLNRQREALSNCNSKLTFDEIMLMSGMGIGSQVSAIVNPILKPEFRLIPDRKVNYQGNDRKLSADSSMGYSESGESRRPSLSPTIDSNKSEDDSKEFLMVNTIDKPKDLNSNYKHIQGYSEPTFNNTMMMNRTINNTTMNVDYPIAQNRIIVKRSSKPVGTYRGIVSEGSTFSLSTSKHPDHIAIPLPTGRTYESTIVNRPLADSPRTSDFEDLYYVTKLPMSPALSSPSGVPCVPSPSDIYSISNATESRR